MTNTYTVYNFPLELQTRMINRAKVEAGKALGEEPDIEPTPGKTGKYTMRPIEPEDLNTALTPITRQFFTTIPAASTGTFLFGATALITVPADRFMILFGFMIRWDPITAPIGFDSVIRVLIQGNHKLSLATQDIFTLDQPYWLTREDVITVPQQVTLDIRISNPTSVGPTRVRLAPLGYVAGTYQAIRAA